MKRKYILILEGTVFHKYFSHIPFLTFNKNNTFTVITHSKFFSPLEVDIKTLFRDCERSIREYFCLAHMYPNFTTEIEQLFTFKLFFNRYSLLSFFFVRKVYS